MKYEELGKMKNVECRRKNVLTTLLWAAFFILQSSFFVSCKESDNTVEEYPDWKNKNESFFSQLYEQAKAAEAAGSKEYKVIRNWTFMPDGDTFKGVAADHVIVQVLQDGGSQNPSPLYNDTVVVSYQGRLLPSTSYANGRIFKDHLNGATDPQAFDYVKMGVSTTVTVSSTGTTSSSSNIDGFTTVLQHMRVGDFWRVYIPYQLGYGEEDTSTIPAYSTLVFDLYLKAYYACCAKISLIFVDQRIRSGNNTNLTGIYTGGYLLPDASNKCIRLLVL